MRVIAKEWERQIFCLAFSGAKEDMVGEEKAKPRVRQNEAWVGRRSWKLWGFLSFTLGRFARKRTPWPIQGWRSMRLVEFH